LDHAIVQPGSTATDAYARWGKGVHPAALNLGDCFAYALATELRCPLLYLGEDFARTDIRSALPA
jgi:ribonuclease VapC